MSLEPHDAVADLELASRISICTCSCSVHIHLLREDGSIFAAASLSPEGAERIAATLERAVATVRDPNASSEQH